MANWLKQMQSGPEFDPADDLQPLVLRVPGCRRRALPVASFVQWLGECAGSGGRGAFWRRPVRRSTKRSGSSLYREVHERIATELFLVPLYQVGIIYGAAKDLHWQPTPNESMFLNRMTWKD